MLSYRCVGPESGPLVVFLHAGGISSWMWTHVVAQLPDYHCLLIDLPGHGDSADRPWTDMADVADQVVDIVNQESREEPKHLVGLSLGGYVALLTLGRYPELFDSAFISGIHSGGMANRSMLKALFTLTAPLSATSLFARMNASLLTTNPMDRKEYVREARKVRSRTIRHIGHQVVEFEAPVNLSEITGHVCFAAGSEEHKSILSSLPRLASAVPFGSTYVAEGLGHGWSGQDAKLFADTLKRHMHHHQAGAQEEAA